MGDTLTIEVDRSTLRLEIGAVANLHAASHIRAGTDELDGDLLDIDWDPTNSTPTVVSPSTHVDHLTSHLKGIDTVLGTAIVDGDYSAKGKILVGTGVGTWTALTVGTNDHVLTADSAQASGVKWASASGGVSDGDKGDITVSSSGTVWTIDSNWAGVTGITTLGTITTGTWSATAIGATKGGTGLTAAVLGELIYSSAANTWARLTGNTTTTPKYLQQVGNGTVSAAPSWVPIQQRVYLIKEQTAVVYTNMPAAYGALYGTFAHVARANLDGCTLVRFTARIASASGASGSKIIGRYVVVSGDIEISASTTWTHLDGSAATAISTNEPQLPLDVVTGTTVDSGWITLHAAAATEVVLGIAGEGGNASADPGLLEAMMEFR